MILSIETEIEDKSAGETQPPVQSLLQRGLFEPANEFLGQRGKRFRAALIELSYRIGGGRDAIPRHLTDAIEMLHAGSLIVDDIEDNSELRRGEPTLHRRIGLPLALNTGNWMYFRALEMLCELSLDEAAGHRLLGLSVATVRECHEGQAIDLTAQIYDLDQRDALSIVTAISEKKTGALTSFAARLGAIAAGAADSHERALAKFGNHLGICLQMRNDLDELRQLKSDGLRRDDLINARVTWPWAWYAGNCSSERFRGLQCIAYDAINDPAMGKVVASEIDEAIGNFGDQEIESRLRNAFLNLSSVVPVSKPLCELERLLHAINTSTTVASVKGVQNQSHHFENGTI